MPKIGRKRGCGKLAALYLGILNLELDLNFVLAHHHLIYDSIEFDSIGKKKKEEEEGVYVFVRGSLDTASLQTLEHRKEKTMHSQTSHMQTSMRSS